MKKGWIAVVCVVGMMGMMPCMAKQRAFGAKASSVSKEVSVVTDEFTSSKTYEYSKNDNGFSFDPVKGLTVDQLSFRPSLVTDDEGTICTPFLALSYTGTREGLIGTNADNQFVRFILLRADKERLEIIPNVGTDVETGVSATSMPQSPGADYNNAWRMHLTKEQFDIMKDFFTTDESIEGAAYTADGKAFKLKAASNSIKVYKKIFGLLEECLAADYPDIAFNDTLSEIIIKQ